MLNKPKNDYIIPAYRSINYFITTTQCQKMVAILTNILIALCILHWLNQRHSLISFTVHNIWCFYFLLLVPQTYYSILVMIQSIEQIR